MPVRDAVAGDVVRQQQSVGGGTWWGIATAAVRTGWDIATAVVRTRGTYHGSGRDLVGHSHDNGLVLAPWRARLPVVGT